MDKNQAKRQANATEIQVFKLHSTNDGLKFIPIHNILHCNHFEANQFYHIKAYTMSGFVTADMCNENDYPGYDIECVSHDALIDVTDNLGHVYINKDNSVIFLSPASGSLECYFSRCYLRVSDSTTNFINIVVTKLD